MKKYLPGEPLPRNIAELRDAILRVLSLPDPCVDGSKPPVKGFYTPKPHEYAALSVVWPTATTDEPTDVDSEATDS
jgi:hypothetical protein